MSNGNEETVKKPVHQSLAPMQDSSLNEAVCTRSVTAQTISTVSFQSYSERFEEEIQLITCMKDYRYADALDIVTSILESYSLTTEERFKYTVLKLECYLQLLMFIEARDEGPKLFHMAADGMQVEENEVASIALKCREKREFIRAMLYYQCSLHCCLRDMRNGRIRKRSIHVINRAEKLALVVYHLGLSSDTKGIVYEYALQLFHSFIDEYESGPERLSVHRDMTILGCCYFIATALKKLNDPKRSLIFTSKGNNIGMKTMKEHKNHLLAKSHFLAAKCYLELNEPENARSWLEVALKLCPFITNWDFQSQTETRKEFEEEVKTFMKKINSSDSAA